MVRADVGATDGETVASTDNNGWRLLENPSQGGFERKLPGLMVRARPGMAAEMRLQPDHDCANAIGGLHGGFLAAVAEQSLFLPLYLHGRIGRGGIVVIDLNLSFLVGGTLDAPIVAHVELLRETGRMAFIRGTLSQREVILTSYSGTVRKLPPPSS